MMERTPEPELMLDPEQADAYARADFDAPHSHFIEQFRSRFQGLELSGYVLDLGCGPGDIALRFANAFPDCRVDGVDGAPAMLEAGALLRARYDAQGRVRLHHCVLPDDPLPRERYDAVISNSLLHHLHDPQVLWTSVRRYAAPGAAVFVMDLMRPESREEAQRLVQQHAAGEPEILRRDFFRSLLAAFTVVEVEAQLTEAGLAELRVAAEGDRHLLVWGRAPVPG